MKAIICVDAETLATRWRMDFSTIGKSAELWANAFVDRDNVVYTGNEGRVYRIEPSDDDVEINIQHIDLRARYHAGEILFAISYGDEGGTADRLIVSVIGSVIALSADDLSQL